MRLKDQNVLFIMRATQHGGTENVVLYLCEIFHNKVNNIVVMGANGFQKEKLKPFGINYVDIPDLDNKNPKDMFNTLKVFKNTIQNERITVIHTHHRMAAFYCRILRLDHRIRLINTSHTAFYNKKMLTHFAFRGFKLIACGEGVKKSLVEGLGFPGDRITVICNGVKGKIGNESVNIPEIQYERRKGNHIFAVIGRLSKEKGVEYLVKAMSLLKTNNASCIIVGDGPEENKLREMVNIYKLEKKIVFLGYRQDISNIISQVDFIVQPSLQEGLPLVPIEAFSMGRTVIGTDIDGTAEIIEDHKSGLLVPAGNEYKLAEAIDYLCSIDRTIFEKEALLTFEKRFSFKAFSDSYINYYRKLK